MMRILAYIGLLLALALPARALAQGGGALIIPAERHEPGSVATLTRDIEVYGVVDGDVTSWSGTITIGGTVRGDVVSYGGIVAILPGGQVGGHVLASGGALQIAPDAAVAGQAIQSEAGGDALASLLDLVHPAASPGSAGGVGRLLLGATSGVLLAAFCLLFVALWPRRLGHAAEALRGQPTRALLVGLLTSAVLALALPPLAALLIASVLGTPLLLAGLLVLLVAYVFGLAVLAQWLGRRGAAPGRPGAAIGAVAGLALPLALIIAFAPLWGLALFYLLASPGLGAAILSRGGMLAPAAV